LLSFFVQHLLDFPFKACAISLDVVPAQMLERTAFTPFSPFCRPAGPIVTSDPSVSPVSIAELCISTFLFPSSQNSIRGPQGGGPPSYPVRLAFHDLPKWKDQDCHTSIAAALSSSAFCARALLPSTFWRAIGSNVPRSSCPQTIFLFCELLPASPLPVPTPGPNISPSAHLFF